MPKELSRIKSMDEWSETPREFRQKFSPYIEEEFRRRREGFWFFNARCPYIYHGEALHDASVDPHGCGYPDYLEFQRNIFVHLSACEADPRCIGQLYTKCRRSGYTNICSSVLLDEATQVKDKLLGIQSKTGKDAQEKNIFMKKVVSMFRHYPFFFKPIQDGTTNPRMELAFREPSKRITKNNKTTQTGEALNTVINWKNTTNNAYDGEKLHILYLDEAGKWEKPTDIRDAWRIQRTCLIVGRKIVGKLVGSTVNPMDKGGKEYKDLWEDSDPLQRNANGRTRSGSTDYLYLPMNHLKDFLTNTVDPSLMILIALWLGLMATRITIGAKTYLKNERESFRSDPSELNEVTRQFPFSTDEAFRDSIDGSIFNVGKIYQQIQHNDDLFPNPVVRGTFSGRTGNKIRRLFSLRLPTAGLGLAGCLQMIYVIK